MRFLLGINEYFHELFKSKLLREIARMRHILGIIVDKFCAYPITWEKRNVHYQA